MARTVALMIAATSLSQTMEAALKCRSTWRPSVPPLRNRRAQRGARGRLSLLQRSVDRGELGFQVGAESFHRCDDGQMPAAIKPYSIAVAPVSSAQNFRTNVIMRKRLPASINNCKTGSRKQL